MASATKRTYRALYAIVTAVVLCLVAYHEIHVQGVNLRPLSPVELQAARETHNLARKVKVDEESIDSATADGDVHPHAAPAHTFGYLLTQWGGRGGEPPLGLLALASRVGPGVAIRAVLAAHTPDIVVDVGAASGFPTTVVALRAGARQVISIDPDPRSVRALKKLDSSVLSSASKRTKHMVITAAAGARNATSRLTLRRGSPGLSCFDCGRGGARSAREMYTKDVQIRKLDDIVAGIRGKITLLAISSNGHELEVVYGARRALSEGRVLNVLVAFEPRVLGTKRNAVGLLRTLSAHNMKCLQLKFIGARARTSTALVNWFEHQPVTGMYAEKFYDYAAHRGGRTHLLCLARKK